MAKRQKRRLRRIAYVSYGRFSTSRRIALGVSMAALPSQGMIGREFFVDDDASSAASAPPRLPMSLLDWKPDAVI